MDRLKGGATNAERIPITIVTGFLGAGKTTLLNHILRAEHGLKIAVLVNDFGAVNIDSQLVVGVEGETVSLSNGCICCSIRGDLYEAAHKIVTQAEPPDYIIIETSGVSDPGQVAHTFTHSALVHLTRIDSILTVIDAEQIRALPDEHALLALDQVGMADIVILNKVDLVDAIELSEATNWIREISPRARILNARHAQVPLELILGVGSNEIERTAARPTRDVHVHEAVHPAHDHDEEEHEDEHEHHDHTLVYSTWHWTSLEPVSYKALRRAVETLPDTIYRAKGIFFLAESPDRKGVLHVVGKRASLTFLGSSWETDTPHSQVVFIGTHGGIDPEALQARFDACLARNAPPSELERITSAVIDWLRLRRPHAVQRETK